MCININWVNDVGQTIRSGASVAFHVIFLFGLYLSDPLYMVHHVYSVLKVPLHWGCPRSFFLMGLVKKLISVQVPLSNFAHLDSTAGESNQNPMSFFLDGLSSVT